MKARAKTISAKAVSQFDLSRLRDPAALQRAVFFGAGWGLAFGSAMTGLTMYQNGCVCIDESVWMTAAATAVGIFAIGPLALFGRRQ
jgi:hypothetical protein